MLIPAALAVVLSMPGCDSPGNARKEPPKNIIFITVDTTRADHLSCYDGTNSRTIKLDEFAKEAVRFENCFSATNSTLSSHVSMFTSLYDKEHGANNNWIKLSKMPTLIWSVLRRNGYRAVGFTSGGVLDERSNIGQGLDEFYYAYNSENPAGETIDIVSSWLTLWKSSGRKDDRLFMWVHLFDPHTLYVPPQPYNLLYRETSEERPDFVSVWKNRKLKHYVKYFSVSPDPEFYRNLYKGEVSYMDENIGKLLDQLRAGGEYDETMVIIVADHGESLGEHGIYFDHWELFDVSTHVPLIIKPAGEFTPGTRGQLVSGIDIYPTVMDAVGVDIDWQISGISLSGILAEPDAPEIREELYFDSPHDKKVGVRTKEYLYVREFNDWKPPDNNVFFPDPAGHAMLFDNIQDPGQLSNLYDTMPGLAERFELLASDHLHKGEGVAEQEASTDSEHIRKLKSLGYVD